MSTLATKTVKLGDSGNPAFNFLIKVPSVPDGTLVIERENGTNILSVAADGVITSTASIKDPANQVAFDAASTLITVPNGLVITTFTVTSSETFDTKNAFNASFQFQPQVAGYYIICVTVSYTSAGVNAASSIAVRILKNGSTVHQAAEGGAAGTCFPAISASGVVFMNGTSDVLTFVTLHNGSGSAINVSCRASGALLIPT